MDTIERLKAKISVSDQELSKYKRPTKRNVEFHTFGQRKKSVDHGVSYLGDDLEFPGKNKQKYNSSAKIRASQR